MRDDRQIFLAAVGDANDPVTWSGIPYHFLLAGRAAGFIDEGLSLGADGPAWWTRRALWNVCRVLAGDRRGGYQYSVAFLERLWRDALSRVRGGIVINCFQLFPPSVVADDTIERWYFIDQTLRQLFDYYGLRPTIGKRIAADALEREAGGYAAAAGVIAHSHWAAESVIREYGINPDRVHVVVPGANLDPEAYRAWAVNVPPGSGGDSVRAPRLVFVGKYWYRKGLDRLLEALQITRAAGGTVELRVIGCARESLPAQLRNTPGVEWAGFVHKHRDPERFIRLVAECDAGCLLSRAEAGGIALREYHALGLAVLGPDTGGAPDHMFSDAAIMIKPDANAEMIANQLLELEREPKRLAVLRQVARARRHEALWETSVANLEAVLCRAGTRRRASAAATR